MGVSKEQTFEFMWERFIRTLLDEVKEFCKRKLFVLQEISELWSAWSPEVIESLSFYKWIDSFILIGE